MTVHKQYAIHLTRPQHHDQGFEIVAKTEDGEKQEEEEDVKILERIGGGQVKAVVVDEQIGTAILVSALISYFGKSGFKNVKWKLSKYDPIHQVADIDFETIKDFEAFQQAISLYTYHQQQIVRIDLIT